jgi:hypothetical protein
LLALAVQAAVLEADYQIKQVALELLGRVLLVVILLLIITTVVVVVAQVRLVAMEPLLAQETEAMALHLQLQAHL